MIDSCHVTYGLPGLVLTSPVRWSTQIRVDFKYRCRETIVFPTGHFRRSGLSRGVKGSRGMSKESPRRGVYRNIHYGLYFNFLY